MPEFNALNDYTALLERFAELIALAEELHSPNPEDDVFIRAAIVGFSYNCPTEQWGDKHFNFILQKREGDYSNTELGTYGDNGKQIGLFACLCLGYLLGLFQADKITEPQFQTAEAQLAGFITLNLNELASLR